GPAGTAATAADLVARRTARSDRKPSRAVAGPVSESAGQESRRRAALGRQAHRFLLPALRRDVVRGRRGLVAAQSAVAPHVAPAVPAVPGRVPDPRLE